ncbi:MAG: hypothetical protein EA398_08470, partial [Deltaproteobacteria bacterium]
MEISDTMSLREIREAKRARLTDRYKAEEGLREKEQRKAGVTRPTPKLEPEKATPEPTSSDAEDGPDAPAEEEQEERPGAAADAAEAAETAGAAGAAEAAEAAGAAEA